MKLNGYIMAAEPPWIEASVMSYYDMVERIVVSYDKDGLGWTGAPLPVEDCLRRLRAIDRDNKFQYLPGHYAREGHTPIDNDTHQRQEAFDAASEGADWVLQIDTDEVIADPVTFRSCLEQADCEGFTGLDYPARWIYRQIGRDRYLEACNKLWNIAASFPGPVAAKPGATLHCARQCDAALFRVDFRPTNTDPWRNPDVPVHRTIGKDEGIFHFSWVRQERYLRLKFAAWGHAHDRNWHPELRRWLWAGRHPYLMTLAAPLPRRIVGNWSRMRIVRIPPLNNHAAQELTAILDDSEPIEFNGRNGKT